MSKTVAVAACAAVVVLGSVAVGGPAESEPDPIWPGAPNPASALCVRLGGISRAADVDAWGGAQIGLCRLRDDALVDEWTLFRALGGDHGQAMQAFLAGHWQPGPGPIEDWAAGSCAAAGGSVVECAMHLRPSTTVELCELPDGSMIEAWTIFGGPDFYPDLARLLGEPTPYGVAFQPCPWPRTCAAPCLADAPADVLCRFPGGEVKVTSFACCCCGSGTASFAPLSASPQP